MSSSVFHAIGSYVKNVCRGAWSIAGACSTVLPYLFRWGDLHNEVTEDYPDPVSSKTADDLPPRSRGFLMNDIDRCTGCGECQKVCPVECIRIESEPGADSSKIWVSIFDIDFSKCIFCGLCVEVCLPASLTHTKKYEGSAYDLRDLVARYGRWANYPRAPGQMGDSEGQQSESDEVSS